MNNIKCELRVYDSMTGTKIDMTPEAIMGLANKFNVGKIENLDNPPTMRDWFDMIGVDYKEYESIDILDSTPTYIGFVISIGPITNSIDYKIVYGLDEVVND